VILRLCRIAVLIAGLGLMALLLSWLVTEYGLQLR
jgi:hypothetical protein